MYRMLIIMMVMLLAIFKPVESQCIGTYWDPSYTWVKDCTPANIYDGQYGNGTAISTYSGTATIMQGATPRTLSYKLHYFKATLSGALTPTKMPLIVGLHPWSEGSTIDHLLNIESAIMEYEGAWEDLIFLTVALENGNNLNTWWDGSKVSGVPTTWAMDGIVALVKSRILDATALLTANGAVGIGAKSIDTNRVYLVGTSMGGSGAYHIGVRHPEIFAAIHANAGFADYDGGPCGNENFCTSFTNDFIGTVGENLQMKGLDNVNYPARSYSNMSWFVGTHNGVSWTNSVGNGKVYEPPYINITHGKGDVTVDISSVNRLVTTLQSKKFGYSYNKHSGGHSSQNFLHIEWLLGFKKNQSYLALSSNSTDVASGEETYNFLSRVYWEPSTILDQTDLYQVKIYGPTATVSVTPRRLQNFVVTANKAYHYWTNVGSTGPGTAITASASGVLTIPSISVASTGTVLKITADEESAEPAPIISTSPASSIPFGSVQLTSNSSINLTVTNNGNANLSITGASITGAQSSQFSITASTPITVTAGNSTNLPVRFTPSGVGSASATLTITSNDATNPTLVYSLTGTGTEATILVNGVPVLPTGSDTVRVTTTAQLVSALAAAPKKRTILLSDGTYSLTSVLPLRMVTDSVAIYGASKDPTKVILTGGGFTSSNINEELIKIEAVGNKLAYFTLKNGRANGLKIQTGANHNIIVHNVHFVDIGERSIKGPETVVPSRNGIVRYCLFEQVTAISLSTPNLNGDPPGDYIAGMDMMRIEGWRIHNNVFKNIRGVNGGARAAVFLWNQCKNNDVDNNIFIGNDRAISFGNTLNTIYGNDSGSILNNTILAGANISLELVNNTGLEVKNNVILDDTNYFRTLFFSNNGTINFKNNTVSGKILLSVGSLPDTSGNLWIKAAGISGVPATATTTTTDTIVIETPVVTSTINDAGTTALFEFDEGTGTTTTDTKNNIVGTMRNVTWTANGTGYGATFNGTNSYITANSNAFVNIRDTFSIDIVFKLSTTSERRFLVGMRGRQSIGIEIDAGGKVQVILAGNGSVTLNGIGRVDNGNWHTLTIVNKKPLASLYIDGVLQESKSTAAVTLNNLENILIGHLNLQEFQNRFFFSGTIDLIRFSRIGRTLVEHQEIHTISGDN